MLVDTHCHLRKEDPKLEEMIAHMDGIIIVSGIDRATNEEVVSLCHKYPNVYGTIGIQPEEVDQASPEDLLWIESKLSDPKIVGIGEIGLDYHFRTDNKEQQRMWFQKQIHLSKKYHKCMVIHSRDAIMETYELLQAEWSEGMRAILHCYSSSLEMAKKFTAMGVLLGIGGVVTFKNAAKLKEVVKGIDLSYLVLETDSPFLSPEPWRGSTNEPANTYYVACEIAKIKGISVSQVAATTTATALAQFDLKEKI